MTVRPKTASRLPQSLERLENRTLLAVVDVGRFGAIPDNATDDGAAIQRAINASAPGDTIQFAKGVYVVGGTLTVQGNRTYQGVAGSTLAFRGLSARQYGLALASEAHNVVIQGFTLKGGGISLTRGPHYRNVKILNNTITEIAPGTRGVYATISNFGLIVEGNVFSNYREWGAMIYHMDQGSFSRNKFHNIVQGAQIVNPYDNVQVSFNGGCGITRMGIEIQQFDSSTARATNNLTVAGNVFWHWNGPYWDSFGLSIMPQHSFNTRIINNYVYASGNSFSQPDSGGTYRWGYGIEAGFRTGVVEGNIVAGPWANHVVVSMQNTPVRNNKFYGSPSWGRYVVGEPGMHGHGSADESGNTADANLTAVPPPPFNPCEGITPGGGGGGGLPGPGPGIPTGQQTMPAPTLTARVAGPSRVQLTWTDPVVNELGFKVERSLKGPDGPYTPVTLTGRNIKQYSDIGLPPGSTVWYRVRAYAGSRPAEYSNVVSVKLPGGNGGGAGGLNTRTLGGTGGTTKSVSGTGTEDRSPFSDLLI